MPVRPRRRLPVARGLCRHFAGGELSDCTRAGLDALRQRHRVRIHGEHVAACSVDLDACHKDPEETSKRWDYVVVLRGGDDAIAIEPHPAFADEVDAMIAKKAWAAERLARGAPTLNVVAWVWLTGSDEPPGFTPNDPAARRLVDADLRFPQVTLRLE